MFRLPVHPQSRLHLMWECASCFWVCCDVVWLPLQAFDIPSSTFSSLLWVAPMIFWTLDMLVSFIVGFYTLQGKLELGFRAIAVKYLKSWFVPDLLLVCNDWATLLIMMLSGSESDSGLV